MPANLHLSLSVAALFKGPAKKSPTAAAFATTGSSSSNNSTNNNSSNSSSDIDSIAAAADAEPECRDELLSFGQPTPLKLFSYKECPVPLPSHKKAQGPGAAPKQHGRPSAPHPIRRVHSLDSAPAPLSMSLPSSFSRSAMAVATRRASAPSTIAPELVRQQQEKVSLEITMAGKTDALTAQLFRSYRKTRDLARHAPQVRHH